jgi:pimeloyl-ACP methyl ester carboxylesterase
MPLVRTSLARLKRLAKIAAIAAIAFAVMGIIYEQIGRWQDRKQLPQIGRSVDIGGRSLNLYCSGEGSPTVIFESNWGSPGYLWVRLQRQVAAFTRACWYDRAGLGWSDPGPFPNHSDSIAHDLHDLLTAAEIGPPYILVGHAMGGFHVRVFRSYFPDEVAGMVLVDPMNEDMTLAIHNHNEMFRPTVLTVRQMIGGLGLLRLLRPSPGPPTNGFSGEEWKTLAGLYRQPKAAKAAGGEPPMWVNGELARATGNYGDLPLVVLSAGIQDQEEDPKLDHDHARKLQLHAALARRSSRGTHVVVAESGHDIPVEAPDAVITAIRDVIKQSLAASH